MDASQLAQDVITQWADAIDLPGLAFDEDGIIELQLGGDLFISLALDEPNLSITACAQVRPAIDDLSTTLVRRLLITNAKLQERDGPSFAVDPSTGCLVLQLQIPLRGLVYSRFEYQVQAFVEAFEKSTGSLNELAPLTAN